MESSEKCADQYRIGDKGQEYDRVIVPMAFYWAEAWGMRSAETNKVNVCKMNCISSLVGMSRIDKVRNEEVCIGDVEYQRSY